MAEIGKGVSPGKLASNVQKRITRAQEKVMQKLGKADETKDMAFEEEVANFNKQLADGSKLQRDLKAYLVAVKTMHECSKRLHDCLAEIYDPEWFGKEEVDSLVEDTDLLWQDFHQKLMDNALISMDTYLTQFPDIKARIAKRERKLVDFDSARHHFASIQKAKKKDEAKIAKAEEDLGRAQKVFEEINYELQEELPTLFNSRVGLYVDTFQSVAGLEEKFHRDMGKLNQNLSDIMTKLDEQRQANEAATNHNLSESGADIPKSPAKSREGPPSPRPPRPSSCQEVKQDNITNLLEETVVADINITTPSQEASWDSWQPGQTPATDSSQQWDLGDEAPACENRKQFEAPNWDYDVVKPTWDEGDGGVESWGEEGSQVVQGHEADVNWGSCTVQAWEAESNQPQWEELQSNEASTVTNGSSDAELPPSVVYKVKVMHDYGATDNDELDLKAGDIVYVIPFPNPEEQDDGWLMGVKESHWLQNKDLLAKGVFPENFTQKL